MAETLMKVPDAQYEQAKMMLNRARWAASKLVRMDRASILAAKREEAERIELQHARRAAAKQRYQDELGRPMPPWRKLPIANATAGTQPADDA